jgi:hypothetical protein
LFVELELSGEAAQEFCCVDHDEGILRVGGEGTNRTGVLGEWSRNIREIFAWRVYQRSEEVDSRKLKVEREERIRAIDPRRCGPYGMCIRIATSERMITRTTVASKSLYMKANATSDSGSGHPCGGSTWRRRIMRLEELVKSGVERLHSKMFCRGGGVGDERSGYFRG